MFYVSKSEADITQQFEKANTKFYDLLAKGEAPTVFVDGLGQYGILTSEGKDYSLTFAKCGNENVINCTCEGGQHGLVCYHAAACLPVHTMLKALQLQSQGKAREVQIQYGQMARNFVLDRISQGWQLKIKKGFRVA